MIFVDQGTLGEPTMFMCALQLAGKYSFTAVATDNQGLITTSNAVTITVNSGAAQLYFIYTDQLNTPRVITDQTNKVVWRWDNQDPFGANVPDEDPNNTGNHFTFNPRFPGQYFDRETNLNYNYFRDYDLSTGRYIQSDPVGIFGGLNTYAFVRGNPVSNKDPSGLLKVSLTFGGGLLFGEFGWAKESGVGFDTSGNVCFVVNNCEPTMVIGGFAVLGGTFAGEKGQFCQGTSISRSNNVTVDLGLGEVGGISATTDESGRVSGGGKAFGGVGGGLGVGFLSCETRTICANVNPFR